MFDHIYRPFLGFLTQLQVQHSNFGWSSTITTPTIHLRPIPDPSESYTLAVDEMELNYLRVDFIILFLNGVVSYLVNVMLDHIMVARIHPNPCILTTLYIWLIILTTLYIYICPIILTTLYIRPENRLLLNSLMKMMSAGIRDKFNIKWELLTIMFLPPTFF